MALSPLLSPLDYSELPGWPRDDHAAAFEAFRRSAFLAKERRHRSGGLGIGFDDLADSFSAARHTHPENAREFFESQFHPCRIALPANARGFVTGFYEPIVSASREPADRFDIPLYAMPDDLEKIDDTDRPADLDPGFAFAVSGDNGYVEYHDRRAIEAGALAGRGLEIAWLADRVDAFFVHVQGAARLEFSDGSTLRVTYAGKSGHPFTGPGKVLAEQGEIAREKVTMQSIRAWFRANPDRIDEILQHNRSYIFFREAAVDDESLGPVAAAKVPLTPGRSMAVDRLLHTFATPIFVVADQLDVFGARPFRRLMIAQDTGSAIVGPARGDLFTGSGNEAGEIAGVIKHAADFFVLVPRALAGGAAS